MPKQRTYEEQYRQPYPPGLHVAKDHAKLFGKSLFSRAPRGLLRRGHARMFHLPVLAVGIGTPDLEARAVSKKDWPQLTSLERVFLRSLFLRHLVLDVDFSMQTAFLGGKTIQGGLAPDFILYRYNIAVEVQGDIIHRGLVPTVHDETKSMMLRALGISEVLFITESTLRSETLTNDWFRQNLDI